MAFEDNDQDSTSVVHEQDTHQTDDHQQESDRVENTEEIQPTEPTDEQESEHREEKPAKKGIDRRFAHLTARAAAEAQRADQAERRAQELQQLLEATRNGTQPSSAPMSDADVERRAAELVTQRSLDEKRLALINDGVKNYGAEDWTEKTEFLNQMGAYNNQTFMRAIVLAPSGDKIVSELADDPDRLAALLRMNPVDMGLEMGRLSAEVSGTKGRKVTQAPAPTKNLAARAAPITPDIYNTKSMSMKEYAEYRAKTAPTHLGGGR